MKGPVGYVAVSLGLVLVVTAGLWPFLSQGGREGLLTAGGLALLTQLGLHFALTGLRRNPKRFAVSLALGIGVRMAVIVLSAVLLVAPGLVPPASFLLGLAGFLFGLVLLEVAFLKLTIYNEAQYAAK